MSYSLKNSSSEHERGSSDSGGVGCCSTVSSQLKIYQTLIFSIPIFFTFVLVFLFYWLYLRRRRADWSSLRMRAIHSESISRCELGLKKELREMLPIIIFMESFSVKDSQCSVCLGEYQVEDRLQQIPGCGHTFHMDCIDLWLTTHTTCPLCRQSLLASAIRNSHVDQPHTSELLPEVEDEGAVVNEDIQCEWGVETVKP